MQTPTAVILSAHMSPGQVEVPAELDLSIPADHGVVANV
jgi:hypothetical protein